MSDEISIKVNIADTVFPLTIAISDEEQVRKAAKLINEHVKRYREEYGIADKSTILSMIALQLAGELQQFKDKNISEESGVTHELKEINDLVEDVMNSNHD